MTLLFMDGFDEGDSFDDIRNEMLGGSTSTTVYVTGRSGSGKALELTSSSLDVGYPLPQLDNSETIIVGFAHRWQNDPSHDLIRVLQGITEHLVFRYVTGGELAVDRGTTQLAVTSGLGLVQDQWYYFEFKFRVHDTLGTYEVRVDEVTTSLSATGQDTNNGASPVNVDYFQLVGSSAHLDNWWDDLYVLDGNGTENNDYLGDCWVETLFADGDGFSNDFSPLSGLTNYEMIDETPPDEDTSYVESSTVGHTDLYDYPAPVQTVDTIYGVKVGYKCRIAGGLGTRVMRSAVRSGGVTYEGSINWYLGPSWRT